MARATSIAAYYYILNNGLLAATQERVYDDLYHNGPSTAFESHVRTGLEVHHSARFNELVERGVVQVLPARVCTQTGRTVTEYDVTTRAVPLPRVPRKKKPKRPSAAAIAVFLDAIDGTLDQYAPPECWETIRWLKQL